MKTVAAGKHHHPGNCQGAYITPSSVGRGTHAAVANTIQRKKNKTYSKASFESPAFRNPKAPDTTTSASLL